MVRVPHSPNELLASLPDADLAALRPHLEDMELAQGTVLFEAGDIIDRVYFPNTGIISLVVGLASGDMIESGMVGRDSLVGGSSALDGKVALNTAIVQIAGAASSLGLEHLKASPTSASRFARH